MVRGTSKTKGNDMKKTIFFILFVMYIFPSYTFGNNKLYEKIDLFSEEENHEKQNKKKKRSILQSTKMPVDPPECSTRDERKGGVSGQSRDGPRSCRRAAR